MERFTEDLRRHLAAHPSAEARDVLKFCYQAAFGAEHLLTDLSAAEWFFMVEYFAAEPTEEPLTEPVGPGYARINLRAWKGRGLPPEWLYRLFVLSAVPAKDGEEAARRYLGCARQLLREGTTGITAEAFDACAERLTDGGFRPVHHSEAYRAAERPSYRLTGDSGLRALPVLLRLADEGTRIRVIALDGPAGAGKTTLSETLSFVTGAPVIHMDDFFLPAEMRTAERLAAPGGNVHHERMAREVLPHLRSGEAFAYGRFDCARMTIGERAEVPASDLRIVEGSYSLHPALGDYADLRVFCEISPEEQERRILQREGPAGAARFRDRWIPMENRYFDAFGIRGRADLLLRCDDGR